MPPGRTRERAARRSSSWSSCSGSARQRRSGREASTPSPEHGASTSARSKPSRSGGRSRPSARTTRTSVAPNRLTVFSSRSARASSTSTATTSPASIVALPPGAAQRSSVRSPGRAPTAWPTSCEARLCGQTRPAATASSSTRSTTHAPGMSGSSRPSTSPRTSRTAVSGSSFCATISPRASFGPSSRHHVSAIQSGYEWRSAASSAVASGRDAQRALAPSASRRRTAFANGTARSRRAARTSSTDSFTAA